MLGLPEASPGGPAWPGCWRGRRCVRRRSAAACRATAAGRAADSGGAASCPRRWASQGWSGLSSSQLLNVGNAPTRHWLDSQPARRCHPWHSVLQSGQDFSGAGVRAAPLSQETSLHANDPTDHQAEDSHRRGRVARHGPAGAGALGSCSPIRWPPPRTTRHLDHHPGAGGVGDERSS